MAIVQFLAASAVRVAGSLSPRWGAAVALPVFARVAAPHPVGPLDAATMWRAARSTVRVPGIERSGTDVTVYEWGRQRGEVVVLAHGWNGRAAQFATLVRELVSEGYRVVAFDAPAHGDSGARAAYIIDWVETLGALQQRYGRFTAVVGHSFGGLATLIATAHGVAADRVITVAAPADAELLLTQFQAMLGFDGRTAAVLRTRFARRYFPHEADPFSRLSSVRHPVPQATRLLVVHDEGDRVVPIAESARISDANPSAQRLTTRGLGHSRILQSDQFLDAVLDFLATPTDAPSIDEAESVVAAPGKAFALAG
jgi:pimeloyl-ACP methyl ester carboxylesterase